MKILPSLMLVLLAGCTSIEYHENREVPLKRADATPAQPLDLDILPFDPGLDNIDKSAADFAAVRKSEALWMAMHLQNALASSNAWGAVRVMPAATPGAMLSVQGKIVHSDGEQLRLQISASDATGKLWFLRTYHHRTNPYAYSKLNKKRTEPFQPLFNSIANDLYDARQKLQPAAAQRITNVANMRFASDLDPGSFDQYLRKNYMGRYSIKRLPADNDPALQRIHQVRKRNEQFADLAQDYYSDFVVKMTEPYQQWRMQSYQESVRKRQLTAQANQELLVGLLSTIAGLAALSDESATQSERNTGHLGVYAGSSLISGSYQKRANAELHHESLRELSESLNQELEPSVINLQERTVVLSGTMQSQFGEWRKILAQLYAESIPQTPPDTP